MIESRYDYYFDCIDSNDDQVRVRERFTIDTDSCHYAQECFERYCQEHGFTHVRVTYSECTWNPANYGKFSRSMEE